MKKKNLLYIVCALAMGSLCGCDDFLNKDPQDKQTNDTYWQTETSLRTYAQDFYSSYFTGYGTDYTVFAGYFSGDDYTDDFINLNNANTNGSGYIYFSTSATTDWNSQTGTWSGNYSVIYKLLFLTLWDFCFTVPKMQTSSVITSVLQRNQHF